MDFRSSNLYVSIGGVKHLCYAGQCIKVLTKTGKPTKRYLDAFQNSKGEVPYYNEEKCQLMYRVGGKHVDDRSIVNRSEYFVPGTAQLLPKWCEEELLVAVNEAQNVLITDNIDRLFDDNYCDSY
jgi:hypothetical protein